MKLIAVKGCQLQLPEGMTGTITINGTESSKVTIEGKNAYKGNILFDISNFTGGAITDTASGSFQGGVISGSAQKTMIENEAAVLVGDKVTVVVNGTMTTPEGTQKPASQSVEVEVISAGQSSVEGN